MTSPKNWGWILTQKGAKTKIDNQIDEY
jgi:hypothetical protein